MERKLHLFMEQTPGTGLIPFSDHYHNVRELTGGGLAHQIECNGLTAYSDYPRWF